MTTTMNIVARAAGAGSVALLLAVAVPGTAQAAGDPQYAGCTTTGASALMRITSITNDGPASKYAVHFEISDTVADGHHASVRLLTKDGTGTLHRWPWHSNTSGTGTITVNTTAQDDRGIFASGVEVARAEGSTVLNSCTDWT
ncbi:hypothetical protein ABZX90_37665 [Streptomyces sp. NPDC002935]|uniref:hypothetical protein n=1 Tax=Streptomyces sp. NPDC002935 TaxID=3154545 RepID=UPI0033BF4179